MNWLRRHGPILLGILVSGLLTALAFRNVRFSEVAKSLSGIRFRWLPFMAMVILGDMLVRSLRWRLLLSTAAPGTRVWPLVRLETIGLAINNVVFLRIGEIARAYLASREFKLSVVTVLATIFVERVLDMITITALFAVAGKIYPELINAALNRSAFIVVGGLSAGLFLLVIAEGRLEKSFLQQWLDRYPKVGSLVNHAVLGARSLNSVANAIQIISLGSCLWLLDAMLYWFGGMAMGLNPHLDYGHSLLVLSSAAGASFLPAVPGSFGAYEQTVKSFLVYIGIDGATALGYAGMVHLVNYLLVTGLGIVFLYREGITLAQLKSIRAT